MLMFDFDQLEKKSLQSLQEAYDEAIYCHKIRLALSELADVFEECNHCLTESSEDITKAINYLLPRFKEIASTADNGTLIVETENLFRTTPEDYLVYLGILLTSFLKDVPDKSYVDIYTHSKDFTYETGVFDKTNTFDCVCDKYKFFFKLDSKGKESNIVNKFWHKNTIIYDTAKITFIPNNNNDIDLVVSKSTTSFTFRNIKEYRKFTSFLTELLNNNLNLLEAINKHLQDQLNINYDIISSSSLSYSL